MSNTILDEAGQAEVRRHLLTWWGLANGDTSGFADGFRHDGAIHVAISGALTVVTERATDATVFVGTDAGRNITVRYHGRCVALANMAADGTTLVIPRLDGSSVPHERIPPALKY